MIRWWRLRRTVSSKFFGMLNEVKIKKNEKKFSLIPQGAIQHRTVQQKSTADKAHWVCVPKSDWDGYGDQRLTHSKRIQRESSGANAKACTAVTGENLNYKRLYWILRVWMSTPFYSECSIGPQSSIWHNIAWSWTFYARWLTRYHQWPDHSNYKITSICCSKSRLLVAYQRKIHTFIERYPCMALRTNGLFLGSKIWAS